VGLLEGRGIETYLPTVKRKVPRRDRSPRVVYFPCYLFARLDFDEVPRSSIDWMPGVRRIVCGGRSPIVVPGEMVAMIRQRLEGKEENPYGSLRKGDRVRVTSGPMRDLEGVFDRALSASDRVQILLEVMGRMTAVGIDYTDITKV
jgi:transcriptional antiterminator RfaH